MPAPRMAGRSVEIFPPRWSELPSAGTSIMDRTSYALVSESQDVVEEDCPIDVVVIKGA